MQMFIDIIDFKEKELFIIIYSFSQCQNIIVSMMIYFIGIHQCTAGHYMILHNFRSMS